MAQTYPGYDSKEQHDEYVAALDNELAVLKARKNPRAKEVEAEIGKHRESKPRQSKAAEDKDEEKPAPRVRAAARRAEADAKADDKAAKAEAEE